MKPRVLIVDDEHLHLKILEKILQGAGFEPILAEDGKKGGELARACLPDIILLDIMMPEESGFETLSKLKEDPRTTGIPVIFISALDGPEPKITGFDLGMVDYITKPFEVRELLARIRTHLKLAQAYRTIISEQACKLRQIKDAQQSILVGPKDYPEARFAVRFEPRLEAGGDFYDVFPALGGYGYFVADTCGHDLASSFITSSLKALLQQNSAPIFSPVDTLRNINGVLTSVFRKGKYLTASYVVLNSARSILTFLNAGHPPPVHVEGNGGAKTLKSQGDILGVFEKIFIKAVQMPVAKGDRIYMYTDGLVERFGRNRMKLSRGIQNLVQACSETRQLDLEDAMSAILKELFAGGSSRQEDDVVLLGIEV